MSDTSSPKDVPACSNDDTASHSDDVIHMTSNGQPLSELCRTVFGSVPTDVCPLGDGSNGCSAFRIRLRDQWIKCYECASPERAQMVQLATQVLIEQRVSIPRIYELYNHWVFAEWVEGRPLATAKNVRTIKQLVSYQARIHGVFDDSMRAFADRFVHLEWLLARMEAAGAQYVPIQLLQAISRQLRVLVPAKAQPGIAHPDFIVSNIIHSTARDLVVIDNEFLAPGIGREFDILNSSYIFAGGDEHLRRQYIDEYAVVGDSGTLKDKAEFWEMCYLVKLIGKGFLFGNASEANGWLSVLRTKLQKYPDCNN